ncbi:unnamed protein product, partial [Heterosigma akashiwo]
RRVPVANARADAAGGGLRVPRAPGEPQPGGGGGADDARGRGLRAQPDGAGHHRRRLAQDDARAADGAPEGGGGLLHG